MTTRFAALLALVPSTAFAHPGHDADPGSIHDVVLLGVAVVIGGVAWLRERRRQSS